MNETQLSVHGAHTQTSLSIRRKPYQCSLIGKHSLEFLYRQYAYDLEMDSRNPFRWRMGICLVVFAESDRFKGRNSQSGFNGCCRNREYDEDADASSHYDFVDDDENPLRHEDQIEPMIHIPA